MNSRQVAPVPVGVHPVDPAQQVERVAQRQVPPELVRWPKTTPMRRVSSTRLRDGSIPATEMRPAVGTSTPVSILIVVDLPAPFGPM